MITEAQQRIIAEGLVGENVMPCLYMIENGYLKSRELPVDRFARDDDGYYFVGAKLRVPTKAIVESHYSDDYGLVLQLEELDLQGGVLVR